MLTSICGYPGCGKTSLAGMFANEAMLGEKHWQDMARIKATVKQENLFRKVPLSVPKSHAVFSDFKFYGRRELCRPVKTYDIDGWRIGMPNNEWDTAFIPPYSTVFLIEAQKYYDSNRNGGWVPYFVKRFYERHRHFYLNIFFDCQRPVMISKSIRGLIERFIFPVRLNHDYNKYGELIRTIWECFEFNNTSEAESFSDTQQKSAGAVKTEYSFNGNIFSCYDSFGYYSSFMKGREKQNFTLTNDSKTGWSNYSGTDGDGESYDYEVPNIFLRGKGA